VIDYETYCEIIQLHQQHQLHPSQIAHRLSLDARTVLHWIEQGSYGRIPILWLAQSIFFCNDSDSYNSYRKGVCHV